MNIVLVDPIAVTPAYTARSILRPQVPSLVDDPDTLRETNLVELGSALANLGHRITVVLGDLYLEGQTSELSPALHVVPVETFMRSPFHPAILPMTPALIHHGVFQDADVIQCSEFHQPSTFFACMAGRERGIPLVVWQETFATMRFPGSWYQRLYDTVAGGYVRGTARLFVPRTRNAETFLQDLQVAEASIGPWIPTGIDLEAYRPAESHLKPEDFGWMEGDHVLLLVARLHPSKGVDLAMKVMKRLLRLDPTVRLLVRGSGPELSNLRGLAATLGIRESVRFLDRVSREELVQVYNMVDVVLCTSRNDLMPYALIEASACGRPIVSTDVGAVRDIVLHDETGTVVKAEAIDDLVRSILRLLRNEELRRTYGARARKRMETYFDLRSVAKRLQEVYRCVSA